MHSYLKANTHHGSKNESNCETPQHLQWTKIQTRMFFSKP